MNNFTNNFTKTEALPKTGHVNEVCKEWLVREDGALAYKLQSQEINDFYKGNRFRNAVVREDFPTALHEQIKEREHADKQAEVYRRRLLEQEEHDKRIAKEIADKLERDLQEQQQRELESEMMAHQMQEIYVNLPPAPAPPTASRDKNRPPPRPAKASTLQAPNEAATSLASISSTSNSRYHAELSQQFPHQTIQLQQQHFSNTDGYVGLTLTANVLSGPATPQRQRTTHQATNVASSSHLLVSDDVATTSTSAQSPTTTGASTMFNQFVERSKVGRTPPALTNDNFVTGHHQLTQQQTQLQYRHQHQTSNASIGSTASSSSASTRRNVFDFINTPQTQTQPPTLTHLAPSTPTSLPKTPQSPQQPHSLLHTSLHSGVEELIEYSDVADSIRRYEMPSPSTPPNNTASPAARSLHQHQSSTLSSSTSTSSNTAAQHLTHNSNFNRLLSPSNENLLRTDQKFQKLSPEKYDQIVGNEMVLPSGSAAAAAAERHMQQHADDIELYVDPCDYASLREIGLPMAEIKEMSKKLKQEQKDELLARRLQEMEVHDGLSQEERDRLLAIEAQDKELAKMLQEREKAKAKRAKEKARLRKSQQKESSSTLCSTASALHCGPLLPLPQDCMSKQQHSASASPQQPPNSTQAQDTLEDPLDLEAYSNPIDVIHSQRTANGGNGTLTNGSLNRDTIGSGSARHGSNNGSLLHSREDDIYTLPVDSCRPGPRPSSLHIGLENGHLPAQHNSMTRSENYSMESHHDSLSGHDKSPRMNYSKSGSFDQNSSPTPPYMPIQGTRRSTSSDDRKKKSKDKCTHQ